MSRANKECPENDIKQSDGVVTLMLELWDMRSTHSLPSVPGSFWPGVEVSDKILSMVEIELNCVLTQN